MEMDDVHSLSHSKWNCKYHIVFAPKYRRKVFYQGKKAAIGKILRQILYREMSTSKRAMADGQNIVDEPKSRNYNSHGSDMIAPDAKEDG